MEYHFFVSISSFLFLFLTNFLHTISQKWLKFYWIVPIRRICPLKISFSIIARTITNFKHWFNNICNSFVQLPWNDNFPVSEMYFITKIKIWPLKSKKCNKIFEPCADLERYGWQGQLEGVQIRASPAKLKQNSLNLHIKFNKKIPKRYLLTPPHPLPRPE